MREYRLVEFRVTDPSLRLLLVKRERVSQVLLGLVERPHLEVVVTDKPGELGGLLWLVLWCGVVTSSLALQVSLPERQDVCLFNMRLILANKPCKGLPIVVVLEVQLDVLVVELEALVLGPLAVA